MAWPDLKFQGPALWFSPWGLLWAPFYILSHHLHIQCQRVCQIVWPNGRPTFTVAWTSQSPFCSSLTQNCWPANFTHCINYTAIPRCGIYFLLNQSKTTRHFNSLSVVGDIRYSNLSFILEGMFCPTPDHWWLKLCWSGTSLSLYISRVYLHPPVTTCSSCPS